MEDKNERYTAPTIELFNSVVDPVSSAKSDYLRNPNYCETLALHVEDAESGVASVLEMKVYCCINRLDKDGKELSNEECQWEEVAILNAKDYGFLTNNKITGRGYYLIGVNGSVRIKVDITSITGKAIVTATLR